MELKEKNMEITITEHDYLTMEKTRKWNKNDIPKKWIKSMECWW